MTAAVKTIVATGLSSGLVRQHTIKRDASTLLTSNCRDLKP